MVVVGGTGGLSIGCEKMVLVLDDRGGGDMQVVLMMEVVFFFILRVSLIERVPWWMVGLW